VKGRAFSKGRESFIGLKSAANFGNRATGQMATDTRMDVEYIVTEYGCVSLRGRSTRERARALIGIANFRHEVTTYAQPIVLI
jgi:itaconate CoA-transferase